MVDFFLSKLILILASTGRCDIGVQISVFLSPVHLSVPFHSLTTSDKLMWLCGDG